MSISPSTPALRPIGRLSAETGVKIPTIRFYEKIGLLAPPPRTTSDRRLYDDAASGRLAFIRHARQLGFDLEAIRSLLDLSDQPDRPCADANAIAARHLADVEAKIAQLEADAAKRTGGPASSEGEAKKEDDGASKQAKADLDKLKKNIANMRACVDDAIELGDAEEAARLEEKIKANQPRQIRRHPREHPQRPPGRDPDQDT